MIVEARVSPNAKNESLNEVGEGIFRARVKAPPEKGEANTALIRLFRAKFPGKKVRIIKGARSRIKILAIG